MVIIGSARIDEHGNISGGVPGDQKQTSTPDFSGEVSQQKYYPHPLGWEVIRAKVFEDREKIANAMRTATNNKKIGYDQKNRCAVVSDTIYSKKNTSCDCSSLVRACIISATGKDPGNFTTYNEKTKIMLTGIFDYMGELSENDLMPGDILVTKKKGHTAIVISAENITVKPSPVYYPKYNGTSNSFVDALISVGENDTSFLHRKSIATLNGINGYVGTAKQNNTLTQKLKRGTLIKK